jgi:hypothetical protein
LAFRWTFKHYAWPSVAREQKILKRIRVMIRGTHVVLFNLGPRYYTCGIKVVQWTVWNAPSGSEAKVTKARTTVMTRAATYNNPESTSKSSTVNASALSFKRTAGIDITKISTGTAVIAADEIRQSRDSVCDGK